MNPGYIFASLEPHLIHTVLGSCVAVCLWDSFRYFGGMNHYIYSTSLDGERNGKYGDVAIPYLIELMLQLGSKKSDLKAHIIGGGENKHIRSSIGSDNATLAEKMIKKYQIEIMTIDVCGQFGRKIIFNSRSGEILIYRIDEIRKKDWYGN